MTMLGTTNMHGCRRMFSNRRENEKHSEKKERY